MEIQEQQVVDIEVYMTEMQNQSAKINYKRQKINYDEIEQGGIEYAYIME